MLSEYSRVPGALIAKNLIARQNTAVNWLIFRTLTVSALELPRTRLKGDLTLGQSIKIVQEREARKQRERDQAFELATSHIPSFDEMLSNYSLPRLTRGQSKTLQINIGKLCNLTCHHCHVESGPTKTAENMNIELVKRCLSLLQQSPSIDTVDITGGAPELNPHFKYLVTEARKLGRNVIDRCNLTVFYERGMEDLPEFLASQQVQIVASLPCYTRENVDKQRGNHVFNDSILALTRLNKLGYGIHNDLPLNLVYNPLGASLPGPQADLERDYKNILKEDFGIISTALFTITNMPIKRFADTLYRTVKILPDNQYVEYMQLLSNAFNPSTVQGLMCRNTINVQWDGQLYDCDFNAALDMALGATANGSKNNLTVWDIDSLEELEGKPVAVGKHCFGCTASTGSSCGGAIVA